MHKQARPPTECTGTLLAEEHGQNMLDATNHKEVIMYKNSMLLAIGAALLLSLFCVDGSYAFQIISRKPPVDFMTVAQMNGWTAGPLQVVGILFGVGLVVLIGRGIRKLRLRHQHPGYQA